MATSKRKNFQFSGHETFNLRQNWLYKAVSFCRESLKRGESPNFNGSDAMVSLGVGKNMVSSLKWWGPQTGFLENCGNRILPSELSKVIFGVTPCSVVTIRPEPWVFVLIRNMLLLISSRQNTIVIGSGGEC